jgi:hypothetical protein
MDTAITTTLIASGSAIGGILIKMIYDSVSAHMESERTNADRFLAERKAAYDQFWSTHKKVVDHAYQLHDLSLLTRAGKDVKPEVIENFPASSMRDLVAALEEIRRVARTSEMVEICQRIVELHGAASAATRHFLDKDDLTYGLPFFLANRLREDQELEFTLAYRNDLGIGLPERASKDWLIVSRPWPSVEAEKILHTHVKFGKPKEAVGRQFPKPLTEKDMALVDSPKFQAMIAPQSPPATSPTSSDTG